MPTMTLSEFKGILLWPGCVLQWSYHLTVDVQAQKTMYDVLFFSILTWCYKYIIVMKCKSGTYDARVQSIQMKLAQ
jgi:hypothetical protein